MSVNPLGKFGRVEWAICANDIMQKKVIWASGDNSVQQALTKMEETDCSYLAIGTTGIIEGIISRSDLTGAMSPYLRPMFAKWHRPLDDATLQIRIKWIMTRPVCTIKPNTPVTAIMENMRQSGMRCLTVVDPEGKVVGLVTSFDIFKALLHTDSDTSTAGKTPHVPPLE